MSRTGARNSSSDLRGKLFACVSSNPGVLFCAALSLFGLAVLSFQVQHPNSRQVNYDMVDQAQLPSSPAALVVDATSSWHRKWTVWIPPKAPFPLRPWEYMDICSQAEHIQWELNGVKKLVGGKNGYYHVDRSFIDVAEAIADGALPAEHDTSDVLISLPLGPTSICSKTLTFVMETDDAGMGNTLLAMWLAYGLAKAEGRAFFVDDTRW